MIVHKEYNGSMISFGKRDDNGGVMVNATEMAKPFGKTVQHWGDNASTTEFVFAVAKSKRIEPNPQFANLLIINDHGNPLSLKINDLANLYPNLIKVVKGGLEKQGTWLHEDVALEFARWLSPAFAIWCNDRIKELLTDGKTELSNQFNMPKTYSEALRQLADKVEENEKQKLLIEKQKPKVTFANAILGSENSISVADLAKQITQNGYRIGQKQLFQWLRDNKYLGSTGCFYNKPMQQYMEMRLFELKESMHTENEKSVTTLTTKVTPKGQQYFIDKFIHQLQLHNEEGNSEAV